MISATNQVIVLGGVSFMIFSFYSIRKKQTQRKSLPEMIIQLLLNCVLACLLACLLEPQLAYQVRGVFRSDDAQDHCI